MTNISSKSRNYIFPTIVKSRKANTALIAAVSALAAAVCGLFYCMNLAVFFDSVHFYRFSEHITLSESNFAVFIGWLSAVEVIYYTMFILLAGTQHPMSAGFGNESCSQTFIHDLACSCYGNVLYSWQPYYYPSLPQCR